MAIQPKYILNADDFGPIDFINQGIIELVGKGKINSVQVIANGDTLGTLTTKLKALASVVQSNAPLDIGAHLTLTSGQPMHLRNSSKLAGKWREMVKEINGKFYFKSFMKFHLDYIDGITNRAVRQEYEDYHSSIQSEFKMQIDHIAKAIDAVNQNFQIKKLALTNISCHHNIVAVNNDLFEIYIGIAKYKQRNLSIRAPKVMPKFRSRLYSTVILQFGHGNINPVYSDKIMRINSGFINNKYDGNQNLSLMSPAYSDMRNYAQTGSIGIKRKIKQKKIRNTVKKFDRMVEFANAYRLIPGSDPANKKIVELVFHIGGKINDPLPTKAQFKKMVEHYPGVDANYFDNRIIESNALDRISKTGKHAAVFNNLVSWDRCGVVKYKKR